MASQKEVFESLFGDDLEEIKDRLTSFEYSNTQRNEILEHIKNLDFIPLLTFATTGKIEKNFDTKDFFKFTSTTIAGQLKDVEAEDVNKILQFIFIDHSLNPIDIIKDKDIRNRIVQLTVKEAVGDVSNISDNDINLATNLLLEGVVFQDIIGVTRSTAHSIRRLPESVIHYARSPLGPIHIVYGMLRDAHELPGEIYKITKSRIRKVLQGHQNSVAKEANHIKILDNTLESIRENLPPSDVILDWTLDLLDYDSIEAGIIIYGKTRGIDIKPNDLEAIRETLESDDLTPALLQAFEHLEDQADYRGKMQEFLSSRFPINLM